MQALYWDGQGLRLDRSYPTPIVNKIYPLAEGLEAVAHATRPGALKVLLRSCGGVS
jgi:hypothetical protein